MTLKFCQVPDCHTYFTNDRMKGPKGNKTNQTRRRSSLLWGEFCDTRCEHAWFDKYGTRAVDHFGRLNEVKHLVEENAWSKHINWNTDYQNRQYFYRNGITNERRPLTEEQYNDRNYTINTGE